MLRIKCLGDGSQSTLHEVVFLTLESEMEMHSYSPDPKTEGGEEGHRYTKLKLSNNMVFLR